MHRSAFTLLEIVATLLLLAFGLVAVIGLVQYANRLSAESQTRATALATAQTVLLDPEPSGLVADDGSDSNGDGWYLDGAFSSWPFTVRGYINGYYVDRTEDAGAVADSEHRWVWVTVRVFSGGEEVTQLKRRMLRRTAEK